VRFRSLALHEKSLRNRAASGRIPRKAPRPAPCGSRLVEGERQRTEANGLENITNGARGRALLSLRGKTRCGAFARLWRSKPKRAKQDIVTGATGRGSGTERLSPEGQAGIGRGLSAAVSRGAEIEGERGAKSERKPPLSGCGAPGWFRQFKGMKRNGSVKQRNNSVPRLGWIVN
jgi:hypothetical protein